MPGLRAGVEQLCRAAGDGPVVCLLGAVGPDDVVELIRGRSGPTSDAAILLDIESWADAGARPRAPARGHDGARGVLAGQREDAATLLRVGRLAGGRRRAPTGRSPTSGPPSAAPSAAARPADALGAPA